MHSVISIIKHTYIHT